MSVTFLYQTALPSYQNRTFELSADVGNWSDEGGHTLSRTTTAAQVRTGIAAGKIVSDGNAGNYGTNYISLIATYMPAVILGHTYRIRLYAKSSAATPNLTIANAGNNTGTATALNATTWTKCEFSFTAAAGDVSGNIVRIWIPASTEIYFDDVQFMEVRTFADVMADVGIELPEAALFYPEDGLTRLLNGNFFRQPPKCFNRDIVVDLGVLQTKIDQVFLFDFAFNGIYEALIFGSEEVEVVPKDPTQFRIERKDDCSLEKYYYLQLIEKNARTTHPASWDT